MNYEQRAEELFRKGYNCAQAVFLAFAEEKIGTEEAAGLASAFGGGLSGLRLTCGAVSGMAMAYGLLRGYTSPEAKEEKHAEYEVVRSLAEKFERENGSLICRELLGLDENTKYVPPSHRGGEYYEKRPCPHLCASAARILETYLNEHPVE